LKLCLKLQSLPVTIKTRIGYNDVENFEFLKSFIQTTKDAGSKKFIIHARKALLKKLSPKENLNIPPLKYEFVYQLKEHFKNDEIIINGGIKSTEDIKNHLLKVDGAMIGRAIYHSPYFLADIERDIFNNENVPTRSEVMEKLIPYIQEETSKGVQLNHIMRHTVGLFHGQNGSRTWKQYLSKNMCIRDADLQKVNHIMDQVRKNKSCIFRKIILDILFQPETLYLIFIMVHTAIPAGFAAGLFGIGGGLITVPILFYIFGTAGIEPEYLMHLAVGTSFGIIIPTSIVSVLTHHQHNAVDFSVVKGYGVFVIIGVILGTILACWFKNKTFNIIFYVLLFIFLLFIYYF
jgi:hypothetical protein